MRDGRADAAQFLIVPLFDMLAFSLIFGLGFCWRKKPEFHRRPMLIATCSLTAAAFGRFPDVIMPHNWFYAGVDVLILLGVVRDLVVTNRVDPVYMYGLPILIFGQTATVYAFVRSWPVWVRIAHAVLG